VSLAPAPVRPRARRWFVLAPVFAAFALVAGAGLSFWPGQAPPSEVREKGGPTLRVFVKRGERVFVWNGREAVRPGDRLAFEIHGVGAGFVSVALRSAASTPVLYAGALAPGRPQLPVSFVVDDVGSAEVVSVITAQRPIDPKLHAEAERGRSGAEPWRQILVFPKVVGGGDAGADSGSSTQPEPHHPEASSP
jgi:hypothetical protein